MVGIKTGYDDGTKKKLMETAKKEDVKFIALHFTDINGTLKSTTILTDKLESVLYNGIGFDSSSVKGYTTIEESDMIMVPDPGTFAVLPWSPPQKRVARLICDIYFPDGTRFEGDPRYIAQRAAKDAGDMGYIYMCGPELEFFLFGKDSDKEPIIIDHGGYFDFHPLDLAEDFRRDMILALESFGIELEMSHHECGPSQYEVDFKFDDLVKTADRVITCKMAVKTIAHIKGYIATFMPKPMFGKYGSGMHTHQSLWDLKKNKNVFYDPGMKRDDRLSDEGVYFIGGLLKHARALTTVVAPTVNSYKRLVIGYEAPVHISWAHKNRSALIRVPECFPGMENAMRLELRSPDPSCNPYLALACMCAAGLDGIKHKIMPPEPVEADIYGMSESQRKKRKISSLPGTLAEALDELEKDDVLKGALGQHVYENFMKIKRDEWHTFRTQVTDWEVETYLRHI